MHWRTKLWLWLTGGALVAVLVIGPLAGYAPGQVIPFAVGFAALWGYVLEWLILSDWSAKSTRAIELFEVRQAALRGLAIACLVIALTADFSPAEAYLTGAEALWFITAVRFFQLMILLRGLPPFPPDTDTWASVFLRLLFWAALAVLAVAGALWLLGILDKDVGAWCVAVSAYITWGCMLGLATLRIRIGAHGEEPVSPR